MTRLYNPDQKQGHGAVSDSPEGPLPFARRHFILSLIDAAVALNRAEPVGANCRGRRNQNLPLKYRKSQS